MKKLLILLSGLLLLQTSCSRPASAPASRAEGIVAEIHNPSSRKVLVACHRGDWRNYPENSIPAIESVIRMGVDIMEFDLKLTKDSVLVLCHDHTIDRTTSGKGRVRDITYDSIRRCKLRRAHNVVTDSLRMPTLREALKQYVKEPLGISEMFYGPMEPSLCVPSSYGNPIEERMCAERQITFNGWRDKSLPVCGECNDGNAHYYWHGASGHAGIFATAGALQKLCQFYMTTEKPAFLEAMNTSIFERGLGFDRSNVFPDGCGHSGFTGTSIWFSREHHIGAVILTNKFYRIEGEPPGNSNEFRRAVHYALIGKEPPVLA